MYNITNNKIFLHDVNNSYLKDTLISSILTLSKNKLQYIALKSYLELI